MKKTIPATSALVSFDTSGIPEVEALIGTCGKDQAPRISWHQHRFAMAIALAVAAGLALTACSPVFRHLAMASPASSISEQAIPILDPTADGALDPTADGAIDVDYELEYSKSGFLTVPNFTANGVGWPSLFCWCIMLTVGNHPLGWMEEKLIKQQLEKGIGIFACNEWAVMSDISVTLNRWGPHGFPRIPGGKPGSFDMPTWAIGSTKAQKGVESNPLNSVIFKMAWDALRSSRKLERHDWVVKVDPDAVWFPGRLRTHLQVYIKGHENSLADNVYLQNCVHFQTMQGPIEVMSKRAATALQNNIKQCGGLWGTGEDQFLVKCLKQLGVSSHMEETLLNDKYCDGYNNCHDAWKVAFHPYKDTERFMRCHGSASQAALEKQR